jgi:hypothetical protein
MIFTHVSLAVVAPHDMDVIVSDVPLFIDLLIVICLMVKERVGIYLVFTEERIQQCRRGIFNSRQKKSGPLGLGL